MNDSDIRVVCLEQAVKTSFADEDQKLVLERAQAYYDFVTNKPKADVES